MAGMMVVVSREKIVSRINLIMHFGDADVAPKLDQLRRLRDELRVVDSALLEECLPSVIGLLSDPLSPVRKFVTQYVSVYVHGLLICRITCVEVEIWARV